MDIVKDQRAEEEETLIAENREEGGARRGEFRDARAAACKREREPGGEFEREWRGAMGRQPRQRGGRAGMRVALRNVGSCCSLASRLSRLGWQASSFRAPCPGPHHFRASASGHFHTKALQGFLNPDTSAAPLRGVWMSRSALVR